MAGVTNTNILFQVLQARVRTGGKSSAIMTAEDTGLLLRAHITIRIRSLTILESPEVRGTSLLGLCYAVCLVSDRQCINPTVKAVSKYSWCCCLQSLAILGHSLDGCKNIPTLNTNTFQVLKLIIKR